jgi:biopolymer transport protein ExbB/TolQ
LHPLLSDIFLEGAVMKALCRNFIFSLMMLLSVPLALADVQQSISELGNRDWQVRRAAAESLGDSRATDKPALEALMSALQDPDSRVRRSAADALGQIGEKARGSIPQLVAISQIFSIMTMPGCGQRHPPRWGVLESARRRVRMI